MSSQVFSNRQIVSRLLWKEFRQIQWLLLFVILLGCAAEMLCVLMLAADIRRSGWIAPEIVATVIPILFAVGCGATIFTCEHDNRTFLFQRLLPASRWQILGTKFGLMIGGTIFLFLFFGTAAILMQEFRPPDEVFQPPSMSINGLFVCEMLIWSLFFSMVERRPLYAISKAALCGLGVVVLSGSVVVGLGIPIAWEDEAIFMLRSGIFGILCGLTIYTAHRWYAGQDRSASFGWMSGFVLQGISFHQLRCSTVRSLLWLQIRSCLWPVVGGCCHWRLFMSILFLAVSFFSRYCLSVDSLCRTVRSVARFVEHARSRQKSKCGFTNGVSS